MQYELLGKNVRFSCNNEIHDGKILAIDNSAYPPIYFVDSKDFVVSSWIRKNDILCIYDINNIMEKKKMQNMFDLKALNECNEIFMRERETIVDYKIFDNGQKTVKVYFADGTDEVAVCDEQDVYSFERAIEVCLMKKRLGGSGAYNGIVRRAMKQIKAIDMQRVECAEEQKRLENKKQKEIERKQKRREKKRQEQIAIQKEAYLQAMIEFDTCKQLGEVVDEIFKEN